MMVTHYGYAALLLATIVEGPIATVIGAFLASQGLLDISLVYGVAVAGDLIGDVICYTIGRSGYVMLLPHWRRASVRRRQQVAALGRHFHAHAGRTLLFGKLTHSVGFLVLLTAGAIRIPMPTFLGYNFLGTLPKTALFAAIGFVAGSAYHQINSYIAVISLLIFLIICLGVGHWFRKHATFLEQSNG